MYVVNKEKARAIALNMLHSFVRLFNAAFYLYIRWYSFSSQQNFIGGNELADLRVKINELEFPCENYVKMYVSCCFFFLVVFCKLWNLHK